MSARSTVVHVKVFPGSKKEKFIHTKDNSFEAYVRESAQHNLANGRVRELVAAHFGVTVRQVTIRTGHRSRKKTLAVSLTS